MKHNFMFRALNVYLIYTDDDETDPAQYKSSLVSRAAQDLCSPELHLPLDQSFHFDFTTMKWVFINEIATCAARRVSQLATIFDGA
eukprot:6205380-Pleurochrysis_carterae.AAC.2